MKRIVSACTAVASVVFTGVMLAQAPAAMTATGPGVEAQGSYSRLKPNVIKAAEKMPAADYQYKPTPDIRTFARVVNHITEAQFHSCGAINHTPWDASKMPSDTASKEEIVAALKASFDECDKAYASVLDGELLQVGQAKRSKLGIAWGNVSHDNEQYATLSLYLRLKGLVPPTSEK
ncbi:DinB family protein [Granulicella sp. WH15]|uniref:DinB family protein n=1 Tax=Granulicella sp. WH15 TaxID=2602070 RepID=UPI001366E72E|nr:DinB family protein [Granulicella sp. WH15]QHN02105.1 DinB family protein [Granulicella sp. WH15]